MSETQPIYLSLWVLKMAKPELEAIVVSGFENGSISDSNLTNAINPHFEPKNFKDPPPLDVVITMIFNVGSAV